MVIETQNANTVTLRRNNSMENLLIERVEDVLTAKGLHVNVPVVKGDLNQMPKHVREFVAEHVELCQPRGIYICDGSQAEADELIDKLVERGTLTKLEKMENCYLARTDPADVARVESKTFIVTDERHASVPHVAEGEKGILGQWMSPHQFKKESVERWPGCMKGRMMYVIPFSMGPIGSPLAKIGVQLTDFAYVVLSMRIMTRISPQVWSVMGTGDFVKCVHSVGRPRPSDRPIINHWPCHTQKILIAHFPNDKKIMSYGSGYGGNSLLGKKCFALRIASRMAKDEGWLAEHMLIMSVTNPEGKERFIAAAFPSACGKTNMAMLKPALPGWKVECIGDDIAWMKFDKNGRLRAINPEAGFFGVAPGTNWKTNPVAMETVQSDCIFTNVGKTEDGGIFWEGMEKEMDPETKITTWLGEEGWQVGHPGKAAHPNSRFCCSASRCPIIHPKWEDPQGVPIDAIVFGGRRPEGVPLVLEANSWEHGVMLGAALKSEATAAAEHQGKQIMHDPMAMRPFMGYNFGDYLQHWLNMPQKGRKMPKIFHVNWFRLNKKGKFLWPGFGENIRVIDWMLRRLDGEDIAIPSPVGLVPSPGSIDTEGLEGVDMEELLSLPKDYWIEDIRETKDFLYKQVGCDLPEEIVHQMVMQEQRIEEMM
jgi:phosphoenolpyruvate carboxykinase (GTP)